MSERPRYGHYAEDDGSTFEHYKRGEYVEFADGSEGGRCKKCGRTYRKTTAEANLSMSGYCFKCGYNP
jgi:hypothetical protein